MLPYLQPPMWGSHWSRLRRKNYLYLYHNYPLLIVHPILTPLHPHWWYWLNLTSLISWGERNAISGLVQDFNNSSVLAMELLLSCIKPSMLSETASHYHHCANSIWRHWSYKMPVRYNMSSVWVRFCIFSQLSIVEYVGLCVFSLTYYLCDDWENIYTLSYHHHQIGNMNYYPLLRARSWNNGMRCMSFNILIMLLCLSIQQNDTFGPFD